MSNVLIAVKPCGHACVIIVDDEKTHVESYAELYTTAAKYGYKVERTTKEEGLKKFQRCECESEVR